MLNGLSESQEFIDLLGQANTSSIVWERGRRLWTRVTESVRSVFRKEEPNPLELVEFTIDPGVPHLVIQSKGGLQWNNGDGAPINEKIKSQLEWVARAVPTALTRWLAGMELLLNHLGKKEERSSVLHEIGSIEFLIIETIDLGFNMSAYCLEPCLDAVGPYLLLFPDEVLELGGSDRGEVQSLVHFFELYERIHGEIQEWLQGMDDNARGLVVGGRGIGGALASYAAFKNGNLLSGDPETVHALFNPMGLPERLLPSESELEVPFWTFVSQGRPTSKLAALTGRVFEVQGDGTLSQPLVTALQVDLANEMATPSRRSLTRSFQTIAQSEHGIDFDLCANGGAAETDHFEDKAAAKLVSKIIN